MEKLYRYLRESEKARVELQHMLSIDINADDIQDALQEILQLERPEDLLDHDLVAKTIIEKLKGYPLTTQNTQVEEIVLSTPIIPSNIPRQLTEETIRSKGEIWRIHKNDADPFPSSPHAHNLETGCSLDLSNGKIYQNHQEISSVPKKRLIEIRGLVKKTELPDMTI